jgi:hypothetical protein
VLSLVTSLLTACGGEDPIEPQRYVRADALVQIMNNNLASTENLRKVAEIDHSRMGQEAVTSFSRNEMQPDGIVSIKSPFGFEETLERVNAAIDAQDDTMRFGTLDFQADAGKHVIDIPPSHMILFGAPGPGGKAMAYERRCVKARQGKRRSENRCQP